MPELPPLPPIAAAPLSVALLAHNDAKHLETLVADWVTFLNGLAREYEVLLVDDGSSDGTGPLAATLTERCNHVQLLTHPTHQGEGAALRTALARAQHPLFFYTLCDPRYQPADLKRLLQEIDAAHLTSGYRAGWPVPRFWRLLGSVWRFTCRWVFSYEMAPLPGWLGWQRHLGRLAVRALFGVRNRDVACPFRLIRREIFARIPLQSDGPFVHVEILAKANFLGKVLGEEVPLGDRNRPVTAAARPDAPRVGSVVREACRLFRHADFGPIQVPAATLPEAPRTPAPEP